MGTRKVVVIGGVAAGMSAASQAKRRQPELEVIVFEEGETISYGACGMPYNIGDPERDIDDLIVLTPEQAAGRGIDLRTGHRVTGLDPASGKVHGVNLTERREFEESFDTLILATGARARRLELPGFGLPGVFRLRKLEHGRQIKAFIDEQRPKEVVLLGAGYLAMELSHMMRELGLEVTIVKKRPVILRGWSAPTVDLVVEELDRHGVTIRTGLEERGAVADADGRVEALETDQGRIPCQMILQAIGIEPRVDLAAEAGLRIGNTGAIWVDRTLETSAEGIRAAGDCAETYHAVLEDNAWAPLGTTANRQGRIAGANAAGLNLTFDGTAGTSGFKAFDLEISRTGINAETAEQRGWAPVSVTISQQSRAHAFPGSAPVHVTMIGDRDTGRFLGAEIVGREDAAMRINVLAAALRGRMTIEDIRGMDLVYSPPLAPVWDPILIAANQLIKKVRSPT